MKPFNVIAVLIAGTVSLSAVVATAAPAAAFTPVSELKDVPPTHWAYNAIQTLVEKYEVMEGFPDNTFRGNRTLSRYELAAALAKVMAKVEEMVSSATGQPINVEKGLNPDDLRTIARLQREFRDELEVLKGRVDMLDTRVGAIEKRLRWGGEMRAEYRDFLGASPTASAPFAEYRLRSRLNLDASLTDTLAYHGSLFWDVYGAPQAGDAFATAKTGSGPYTEMYLYKSYGSYTPGWLSLHGGLVNLSDVVTLGSSLKDPFTTNVWREATGGFGFVGTPGLSVDPGATPTFARVGGPGAPITNNVWWLPGTDVALQSLDPNATQGIFPRSSFTAAASGDAGPFNLSVGVYQPGVAGRDQSRLAALGYPASLPGLETYTMGSRMVAALGADFGYVRAQVAAKAPGTFAQDLDQLNKTVTGSLDIGSDALGLSLQGVARTAFTGSFLPTNVSAKLASNDLFGTGFGLGLGTNLGTAVALNSNNLFTAPAGNRSLMQGLSGMDYGSYGLYLRIPGFSIIPSLTLAAQQTAGPGFSGTIASGLTAQAEVQLFELPRMQVEYSSGKFNPGTNNGLLDNTSFISNEQLTGQMVIPF